MTDAEMNRCKAFGAKVVAGYANGSNPASLAVSSHGAEADPALQATAKMGEVAFCKYFGLDIERLNWSKYCDAGYDVAFHQYRVDIKTIAYSRRLLIWPVNKRHFYLQTRFNTLVLVKEAAPRFLIDGWISRDGFYCERRQADGQFPNSSITPGTWFIEDSRLWDIDDLCRLAGHAALPMSTTDAIADGKGFEWVTGKLREDSRDQIEQPDAFGIWP